MPAKKIRIITWPALDYRDMSSYPTIKRIPELGWRWEFLRRRIDYKEDFDNIDRYAYTDNQMINKEGFFQEKYGVQWPVNPLFSSIDLCDNTGDVARYNEDQIFKIDIDYIKFIDIYPQYARPYEHGDPAAKRLPIGRGIPPHFLDIRFDLKRPLKPQIDRATEILRSEGKSWVNIRRNRHLRLFPTWLRILDAHASGLSYSGISELLPAGSRTRHAARDAIQDAQAVCLDFPF